MADDSMAFCSRFNNRGGEDFFALTGRKRARETDGLRRYRTRSGGGFMSAMEIRVPIATVTRSGRCIPAWAHWTCRSREVAAGNVFRRFWNLVDCPGRRIAAVVQEAWINGVSTRKVGRAGTSHGHDRHLKSQASVLCRKSMGVLVSFLNRSKATGPLPLAGRDPLKVRQAGRVVSVAGHNACAVNSDGRRGDIGALPAGNSGSLSV